MGAGRNDREVVGYAADADVQEAPEGQAENKKRNGENRMQALLEYVVKRWVGSKSLFQYKMSLKTKSVSKTR
jgi:hypothetical protein